MKRESKPHLAHFLYCISRGLSLALLAQTFNDYRKLCNTVSTGNNCHRPCHWSLK